MLLTAGIASFSSCDKTPGLVDSTPANRNLLTNGSIKPTRFSFANNTEGDTTLTIHLAVEVDDTTAISGSPRFQLSDVAADSIIARGVLDDYDAQTHRFTGSAHLTVNANQFGEFSLLLYAENKQGLLTNTFRALVTINGAEGSPPQLISVSNPDTVKIPASGTQIIVFQAKVADPDGQDNIDRVLFDLISANTGKLAGSPFQLYDDGDRNDVGGGSGSGDITAGDSVYTRTLQVGAQNTADKVTVKYYAIDKSGLSSDTVSTSLIFIK